MRVLMPASEVSPLIKIGGLGDVVGSLPKALEALGVNVDVAVPLYAGVNTKGIKLHKSFELEVPYGGNSHSVTVYRTKLPRSSVDVFLFNSKEYFSDLGKSAFLNNIHETEAFSFFNKVVVAFIKAGFNTYDIVHCNDWHTGLIPLFLKDEFPDNPPKVLFTIHNLMYQGRGSTDILKNADIIPGQHPLVDWDISDGDLNMLLQGISLSDYVNTVSESYAQEILTPEFGGVFHSILTNRAARLSGILNGIDYDDYSKDMSGNDWQLKKREFKHALQRHLGLKIGDAPIFAYIGRIDPYQKGLDLIYKAIPGIVRQGGQFILLGTGDKKWENKFHTLSENAHFNKSVSCTLAFDAKLALGIYQGSTFLLVPSRYEPCGLIQMIAMYYGTLPIVHNVGGLKDTVIENINGLKFNTYTSKSFLGTLKRAFDLISSNGQYEKMVLNALSADFSWSLSAGKYKNLYERMLKNE